MGRRRDSPLRALRAATQSWKVTQRDDLGLSVDPTIPGESGVSAYCGVLRRRTGHGWCGNVDCGGCSILAEELDERAPDHAWVCSTCTDDFLSLPFWKGGECERCGYVSIVLRLVVPA